MEAELTPKTAQRTAGIMGELLARTAAYGADEGPAGDGPRYARVLYVCSPAAMGVAGRARDMLPGRLAARVQVRALPWGAS